MIRAAIYARVSTEAQAKEGDSIPAQLDALRKYVKEHADMVLVDEYVDDGVSGTKFAERDELQRMLADVRSGKIDIIYFTKLDRFYRSIRHYTATQEVLDKYHVDWKAIWEPVYDTTTPAGRLIVNQMMSIAQFEAENTGLRVRQVFAYKIQQGEVISGKQPIGYDIVGKRLVPNEDAEIVRGLFEQYDLTNSLTKCTMWLREHGIHHGKFMTKEMLTNRKYIGEYRDNPNYCQPIIDKNLFEKVQGKLQKNVKYNQKHTYIFSGIVRCTDCGRKMQAYMSRRKFGNKIYVYPRYRCVSHYLHKTELYSCDNAKVIHEPTLERYLLSHVREELEKVRLEAESYEIRKVDNTKKIENVKQRLNRLKELYLNDIITMDEYKHDRDEMLQQIDRLSAEKQQSAPDISGINDLLSSGFEAVYDTFSDEEKRYFWRSIVKEIQFNSRKEIKIVFF